ncbi:MAG: heme peroxidase [Alphaproteobacteria bacterium]|nr:heme peroxidase [Alphaproteobacteria bacterium]MBU1559602.1 heme peroxidase [Alphaproteobacteria bacterium]MBU2304399.1 heme peroxidase [Alphaproteobacteria bacterium]MBU2367184.1 heme peroxidase [Alphaproteobacteria bacterium]
MVNLIKNDLEFILKQIKIAEAHTDAINAGADPRTALEALVSSPLLPLGLRTVDGTLNNFQSNYVTSGASDVAMTRLLDPIYKTAELATARPGMPQPTVPTSYNQTSGSVYDSQPRVISNLVADQSLNNPAAIAGALASLGITGAAALAIVNEVMTLQAQVRAAEAAVASAAQTASDARNAAQADLDDAEAALLDSQADIAGLVQDQVEASDALAAAVAALDAAIAARGGNAVELAAAQAEVAAKLIVVQQAQATADQAQSAENVALANLTLTEIARNNAIANYSSNPSQANADALAVAVQNYNVSQTAHEAAMQADDAADAALVVAQAAHVAAVDSLQAEFNQQVQLEANVDAAEVDVATAQADVAGADAALADAQALVTSAQQAVDAAQAVLDDLPADDAAATAAANAAVDAAKAAVLAEVTSHGIEMDGSNVFIKNIAADLGDTASFNGFMTIFGQFFDHGLDLTAKGGSGSVYIPLKVDDPLYVEGSHTNFMVLTRATNEPGADGILGTADDVREHRNETTPWTDLNQVYTSNASHQVFLREYVLVEGRPVATGHMLEGSAGGPPTWADIKNQAANVLGIRLDDLNVHSVPAILTDLYGEFVRSGTGFPQLVAPEAPGGVLVGNIGAPVNAMQAAPAGRAFLNDIAHNAAPGSFTVSQGAGGTVTGVKTADSDSATGNAQATPNMFGGVSTYDNELLDRHFIVGDGRGNENIVLTAVHTIFHGEHNRQVDEIMHTLIEQGDLAFLNEWLLVDVTAMPTSPQGLVWDGERLFQAARFSTEMVYQHLVFEEFVRAITPQIDPFVFSNSVEIDAAIFEEFAQVVYRFGHSMLNETVETLHLLPNGTASAAEQDLMAAFLNPVMFDQQGQTGTEYDAQVAAGAILRGMTRQAGNEIDEFMTGALRNNLVGLPLDLAALNMARARETGIPSLNEARRQIFQQTNDTYLKPYSSWTDFAQNIKNPLSVVNFIAAYGLHSTILAADTAAEKRDAAWALVFGGPDAPADRLDFLNATGNWAAGYAGPNDPDANGLLGGLENVDFWIGGLAEALMPFGGMLGSTFTFVFELQIEKLQNGDRFYYLSRTQGMNLLTELESDSFADVIHRNTDTGETGLHINGAAFQTADYIIEMDKARQYNQGLGNQDPTREADVISAITGNDSLVIRRDLDNDGDADYLQYLGGEHVVLGGTDEDDVIVGGAGDDTLWGDGGNDTLEGGLGVDHIHGGEGDDIITDSGTDIGAADVLKGEAGDDVINGGMGLDLVFGGSGKDVLSGGSEAKSIFGGTGDDFIRSPSGGGGVVYGNEGNDWMEGQGNMNTLSGDNSELFFNSRIIGHDIMLSGENDTDFDAESGDDIMVQGIGINRNNGMAGFDWVSYQGNNYAADADMNVSIFTNQQNNILRDRYDLVEGLSGWDHNDTLTGREFVIGAYDANGNATQIDADAPVESFSNALLVKNIALIEGLGELVAHLQTITVYNPNDLNADGTPKAGAVGLEAKMDTSDGSDILLGGGGSDLIRGMAGNDIIDGDKHLEVHIAINDSNGNVIGTALRLTAPVIDAQGNLLYGGRSLESLLFSRDIRPSQLEAVREIVDGGKAGDVDTAVYWDVRENYAVTRNADGSVTVEHVTETAGAINPASGQNYENEGIDRLFNIERLRFADGDVVLSPPELYLQQTSGQYADDFDNSDNTGNSDGPTAWPASWIEAGDSGGATTGQIQIDAGNFGGSNQLRLGGTGTGFGGNNGAMITRAMDLSGASTATISYSANPDNVEAGEWVRVSFAADGVNFVELNMISGDGTNTTYTHNLTGPFEADAAIRFEVSAMSAADDIVTIDNLSITFTGAPLNDFETTFTEGELGRSIASNPLIIEDSNQISSARIVLIDAQAGDNLNVPNNLPGNIDSQIDRSVPGQITVILTGEESLANYQSAIQAITFTNSSQDPSTADRTIQITVSDGLTDSAVATTTVNVVAVEDPTNALNDNVITNVARGTAIIIPQWAFLSNDSDPDDTLDITAVNNQSGLASLSLTTNPGSITFNDPTNGASGGSFTYTATGSNADTASVNVINDTFGAVSGTSGDDILVGNAADSTFDAGGGNDIIFAGAGNDTIVWDVGDGRDFVDGGTNTATGDTFQVNGSNQAENFVVYARLNAEQAGITGLKAATQIVVTREGVVIAELAGIEELIIDTNGGNDNVTVVGNLAPTDLFEETITVNGSAGNDTVDITSLTSAHRILFRTNGGNDTIVGTLRPQDVVELPQGMSEADYDIQTDDDGLTTMSHGAHTISFVAPDGLPQFSDAHGDHSNHDDDDEDEDQDGDDDHGQDDDDEGCDDDAPNAPATSGAILGTDIGDLLTGTSGVDLIFGLAATDYILAGAAADIIRAGEGDDFVHGEAGRDVIFAGEGDDDIFGGDGADMIYGEAGNDRLFGDKGNDLLDAGLGHDTVHGGLGDDLMVAQIGDGNDIYDGGAGIDTLDYGALTEGVDVNLGTGVGGRGSVTGSQSGTDTLYGIENITTGSGNDVIEASNAVNVIDGGDGNDVFVFGSATAAHGDTIVGFEAGDKIDLSGIDADTGVAGVQSFALVTGQTATAPAQIVVTHEVREDGEYTVISGNTAGGDAPEFRISLTGNHTLTGSDFNL